MSNPRAFLIQQQLEGARAKRRREEGIKRWERRIERKSKKVTQAREVTAVLHEVERMAAGCSGAAVFHSSLLASTTVILDG